MVCNALTGLSARQVEALDKENRKHPDRAGDGRVCL